jgi:hypothetical protein
MVAPIESGAPTQARRRSQAAQRERRHCGHFRGDSRAHFRLIVEDCQQQRDRDQRGSGQPGLPQNATHASGESHQDEVTDAGLRLVGMGLALRPDQQSDQQRLPQRSERFGKLDGGQWHVVSEWARIAWAAGSRY